MSENKKPLNITEDISEDISEDTIEKVDDNKDNNKDNKTKEKERKNRQKRRRKLLKPKKKKKKLKTQQVAIAVTAAFYIISTFISSLQNLKPIDGEVTIMELNEMIDNGEIESITVQKASNTLTIKTTSGETLEAVNPQNDTFIYDLANKGVDITINQTTLFNVVMSIMLTLPMIILMVMLLVYVSNTVVGGSTKMFTLIKHEDNNVSFNDIKGLGETKGEVQFIISQLKNWKKLGELGARPVKGALFYGPPGTGKTMLAKAIAKEAGVGFINASGSDFVEMFVGVGAARVRSLFELAALNAPCVIFIDEIDCLGKRRRSEASSEHNQTLNALLQRMDGINDSRGIMIIGATNRKEDLDKALLRPGRFDRHYFVGAPDNKKDRDEIVEIYLENKKLAEDVTLEKVSKLMVGLSGAEIEQSLNEAVYISLQHNRDGIIKYSDIDEAIMKQRTGGVKKEHSSKRDEEIVALHEAGHTIVSLLLDVNISKVSSIPYSSGMGGVTMKDLDETGDIKLKTMTDLMNDVKILLAGKVAEDVVLGEHTQGCSNDLENATKIVHSMITQYGYDNEALLNTNVLLENGIQHQLEERITKECDKLLHKCNYETVTMIKENKDKLLRLRDRLLEEKTIVQPTLENI